MNLMKIPIDEMIQDYIDNFTIDGQDVCDRYLYGNYIIKNAVRSATIIGNIELPKLKRKNKKGSKTIYDEYYVGCMMELKRRKISEQRDTEKNIENQVEHLLSKLNGY